MESGKHAARVRRLIAGAAFLALPAGADTLSERFARAPVFVDIQISSRVFDSPLFGNEESGVYRLFGAQHLGQGTDMSAWFASGFPNYEEDLGVLAAGLPWGERRLDTGAGDFLLTPLRPRTFVPLAREAFPLRGAFVRVGDERDQWDAFAGAPKYDRQLFGEPVASSLLAGGSYLRSAGANHYGGSLTLVSDPTYVDPSKERGSDAVLGGDYHRELSPTSLFFAQLLGSAGGGAGGRAGIQVHQQRWDLSAGLFGFNDDLPYVDPLYRPSESGIELAGRVELSPLWSVSGTLDYLLDDTDELRADRSELRGDIGVTRNPAGSGPALQLVYARNQIAWDSASIAEEGTRSDRILLFAAWNRSTELISLRLEHLLNSDAFDPDRTQALVDLRKVIGPRSLVTGSAVVQRVGGSQTGVTVESALEQAVSGPWYAVGGLGAALVDQDDARSGEGVVRAGVSHRFTGTGWYARLEARIPVSIGLERSHLSSRLVSLDLGTRFGVGGESRFRGAPSPKVPAGSIEGLVAMSGKGQRGIPVLVDGQRAATTRSDGRFRIRRVRAGQVTVAIDLSGLDPRIAAVGGPSRVVDVPPGGANTVDFEIAAFSLLQGSVIACSDGETRPLARARLTLRAEAFERTAETSNLGGFEIDEVPPGLYELTIEGDPAAKEHEGLPGLLPATIAIDLHEDRLGEVIRLGCSSGPESARAR